ncbi:class I SAM-dependent methyltransferase [Microcoleus sp. FACHB-1515]|uniref:class I SAM-dependent methyltransferase n=1 Tax=Cyanophyceae TaxID=3028117 RepID=UPI001686A848|nr:class I SAM-dependent methyltransferase [Microcoleus sp. FACHB-1515]MBD2091620.1 class I SAM-dependent methyltransferase [Microcoleus sp. FACHB-1515]
MDLLTTESNPLMVAAIAQSIAQSPQQRMTFAEFMNLALYHPQHGYYTTQPRIEGDFFTSPHLGADFGELLAVQLAEMWKRLDRPQPFTLLEMGAGQGLLVQDIVRYLHRHHYDCFESIDYRIVEQSPALIAEQQRRLAPLMKSWRPNWCTWDEIEWGSIVGCCFSNELVDAFPVHQVIVQNGQLQEIYVTWTANQFKETTGELSTPKLSEYFEAIDIPITTYPDGYRTEVNLAAIDWLQTVSDRLQRGYVLTIDYGYRADRYYAPFRREGTLQCYFQHQHHSDPYVLVGRQDLTAHVDFTTLQRRGERIGLETIGFTQQGLFLMALGLGDRISALSNPGAIEISDLFSRRESLHALMNPTGLGNFGVLVQGKGLNDEQKRLKGLSLP